MTTTVFCTLSSPVGPITVAGDGTTVTDVRMRGQAHEPRGRPSWRHEPEAFADVVEQLDEYFGGRRTEFEVPLRFAGPAFRLEVWEALLEIPYGGTVTYGAIARRVGRPGAARAVGAAVGRNPVAIIVPCHRVVGAGGSLTGYAAGLDRKRALLDLEREGASAA